MKSTQTTGLKNRIYLATLASLLAASVAQAGGGRDTGGGDLAKIREARIRSLVTGLHEDLLDYFSELRLPEQPSTEFEKTERRMLDLGLVQDIRTSTYRFENECHDSNDKTKAASAVIGGHGGVICFNLPALVASNATERDIYSLAVHEHAHQLGVTDEAEATLIGEALAPRVGAHLYYFPRVGHHTIVVPTDPKKDKCLNLRTLISHWVKQPGETKIWKSTYDLEIQGEISLDFRTFFPAAVMRSVYDPTTEGSIKDITDPLPYQDGCDRVLVPTQQGTYQIWPIISYTANSLKIRSLDPTSADQGLTISIPENSEGDSAVVEHESTMSLQLKCTYVSPPKTTKETHTVVYRQILKVGQSMPEVTPITPRLSDMIQDALRIPFDGCQLDSSPN